MDASLSHSQLLSSSSTSPSKLCSQTYKNASQLFLTRRLQEALAALEPVIAVPTAPEERRPQETDDDDSATPPAVAPIATAPSTWRIKIWNLYVTLLSSIVDLGAEEGKKVFGQKEWKAIATRVREGEIWETVVQTGYNGRQGSVDVEVVHNLATLLLKHSPSQTLNQQRLETYLSSYGQLNLDIAQHLGESGFSTEDPHRPRPAYPTSGTDTPKDLAARVRIIELFALHVLPRNNEWDYAHEFISFSEVLDEERKEVFMQALEGLKEEKERDELRAAELQRQKDAELERRLQEADHRRAEEASAVAAAAAAASAKTIQKQQSTHNRASSEVDYGIEKKHLNGIASKATEGPKSSERQAASKPPVSSFPNGGRSTPPQPSGSSSPKNVRRSAERPAPRARNSEVVANALRNLVRHLSRAISESPLSFLRTLLFMLGIIMALSRQDVRERIRKITGTAWNKVRGTIGMGVKVSYI